jgi:hypothetical protein
MDRIQVISLVAACVIALPLDDARSQTIVGFDATVGSGSGFEFDTGTGVSVGCGSFPFGSTWLATAFPPSCAPPGPALGALPTPPASILGDVAVDHLKDIYFLTDGLVIEEFLGSLAFGFGTSPLNSYALPVIPTGSGTLGPLTGMGFDSFTGMLWVTDGADVAGLTPATGSLICLPPFVAVPAFPHGLGAGVVLTDITSDPFTGTFWVCDTAGSIHNMLPGGGFGPGGTIAAGVCGPLAGPLQGIAYDLSTPAAPGLTTASAVPVVYVTDGVGVVEAIDLTTGAAAAPTFTRSGGCLPLPLTTNGLAYGGRGSWWGSSPTPGPLASVWSYGHSSTPGPSFGLGVSSFTTGDPLWLAWAVNAPGGFLCPSIPVQGTVLHVDVFAAVSGLVPLGTTVAGTSGYPLPVPVGAPIGTQVYLQFFANGGPGAGWQGTTPLVATVHEP